MAIKTIVFDLGGVLVNWDPKNLYSKIFDDVETMEHFLENVCTMEWNAQQDAGRSLNDATEILIAEHPHFTSEIRAYYDRWEEMLNGSIQGTVELLDNLCTDKQYRILALTNWSHETFPRAQELFEFLHWFEGIVVSGSEKLKKPDHKLYQILFKRYQIAPQEAIFIDDSLPNVKAAEILGMSAIHFQSPSQLRDSLAYLGISGI